MQTGRIVASTEESYYEIKGKAGGNQLKGRLTASTNLFYPFVINISSDGLSFEGTLDSPWRKNALIKGKRGAD